MSLRPSAAMTSTKPYDTEPALGSSEQDRRDLEVWRDCVSTLECFTSSDQILGRLRAAARSRRPDPVLTAVCELSQFDRRSMLARLLLVEGFSEELDRVAEGIELFCRGETDAVFVAEACLLLVVEESVAVGEDACGRVLLSRTWARAFKAAQRRADSVLLAEAGALLARAVLAVRDHMRLLRRRPLLERVCGRLSPLHEAVRIRRDAASGASDVGDLAAERGLSPLLVRRQVAELDLVPAGRQRRLARLEATLWLAHDIAEREEGVRERGEHLDGSDGNTVSGDEEGRL